MSKGSRGEHVFSYTVQFAPLLDSTDQASWGGALWVDIHHDDGTVERVWERETNEQGQRTEAV